MVSRKIVDTIYSYTSPYTGNLTSLKKTKLTTLVMVKDGDIKGTANFNNDKEMLNFLKMFSNDIEITMLYTQKQLNELLKGNN